MLGNLLFDFEPGNDRRYWLALISSVVQILGMAALLLAGWLPIPELPRVQALQTLLASPPVSGRLETRAARATSTRISNAVEFPTRVRAHVTNLEGSVKSAQFENPVAGVVGDSPGVNNIIGTWHAIAVPEPISAASGPATRPLKLSRGVMEGYLVKRVQPVYPPLARNARVQGLVVLEARISKVGKIEELRLISGHPLLAGAALDAVRQ